MIAEFFISNLLIINKGRFHPLLEAHSVHCFYSVGEIKSTVSIVSIMSIQVALKLHSK